MAAYITVGATTSHGGKVIIVNPPNKCYDCSKP